jgi:hypothetical protein
MAANPANPTNNINDVTLKGSSARLVGDSLRDRSACFLMSPLIGS